MKRIGGTAPSRKKGYQMEKARLMDLATLLALAVLILYGWRPVAWAIGKAMGWL